MLAARISRSPSGVRPAGAHVVLGAEVLRKSQPDTVALPLVLELEVLRKVAVQVFPDGTGGQAEGERVLRAHLEGRLIGDVGQVGRGSHAGIARELGREGGKGVAEDKNISRLDERIVKGKEAYRGRYPLETREADASVQAAGEYRKMLYRLKADDLPRFESAFKSLLNEN